MRNNTSVSGYSAFAAKYWRINGVCWAKSSRFILTDGYADGAAGESAGIVVELPGCRSAQVPSERRRLLCSESGNRLETDPQKRILEAEIP